MIDVAKEYISRLEHVECHWLPMVFCEGLIAYKGTSLKELLASTERSLNREVDG